MLAGMKAVRHTASQGHTVDASGLARGQEYRCQTGLCCGHVRDDGVISGCRCGSGRGRCTETAHPDLCGEDTFQALCWKGTDVHQRDLGILLHQKGGQTAGEGVPKITKLPFRGGSVGIFFICQQGTRSRRGTTVGVPPGASPHRRCRWSGRSRSGRRCSSPRCRW